MKSGCRPQKIEVFGRPAGGAVVTAEESSEEAATESATENTDDSSEENEASEPTKDYEDSESSEEAGTITPEQTDAYNAEGDPEEAGTGESTTEYTITFNANGGEVTPSPMTTQDGTLKNLPTLSREGYDFIGWQTEEGSNAYEGMPVEENTTLFAIWIPKYTVTFNANGGSVSPESAVSQSGAIENLPVPTREGYKFAGWYSEAANGYLVVEGSSTFYPGEDTTLFAHWAELNKSYTITFESEGGSGAPKTLTTQDSMLANLPTPAKDGYDFDGWYTEEGGEQVDEHTVYTDNTTLRARWIPKYTVTFDANGGSVSPTTSITQGGFVNDAPTPTREGFKFLGWYSERTGGSPVIGEGFTSSISENTTLYAHWAEEGKSYTITLNPTGGTVTPGSVTTTDSMYTGELPTPVREGYYFTGWYTQADGGDQVASENSDKVYTENTTLYAHWEKESVVTFDANGGSVDPSSMTTDHHKLTEELPTPTRTGYQFTGWYSEREGGYKVDNTWFYEDVTLYARWAEKGKSYTITLDPTDGTVTPGSEKTTDSMYTGQLPTPTKEGYYFTGWYTQAEDGEKVDEETVYTGDTTLYAHWKKESKVTFNINDGSGQTETRVTKEGYIDSPTPTREGYEFIGWFTEPVKGEEWDDWFDRDMTVYAHWAKTGGTYTITFDPNGGTVNSNSAQTKNSQLQPEDIPYPDDRQGYDFLGWYTDPKGGDEVNSNDVFDRDTTLYAHWGNYIYVEFDANGGETDRDDAGLLLLEGEKGAALDSLPMAVRDGYRFDGWFTEKDGGTQVDTDTLFSDHVTTLYAHWTQDSTVTPTPDGEYTVAFNPMGGTVTPTTAVTKNKMLDTLPTPTRDGYTFTGWTDAWNEPVDTDQKYYGFTTLYASWKKNENPASAEYNITLIANGGSVNPASVSTKDGILNALPTPTRDGYTFAGWFTTADGGDQVNIGAKIQSDMVLYAHWTQNKSEETTEYTVSLNANGGNVNPTSVSTKGGILSTLPTPTRDGYTFAGWFTTTDGGDQVKAGTEIHSNIALYAHWTANKPSTVTEYNVTLNANGGSVNPTSVSTKDGKLSALPTPTRDGYTFAGWFTRIDGGEQLKDGNTVSADNTVLYAHWTASASNNNSSNGSTDNKNNNSGSTDDKNNSSNNNGGADSKNGNNGGDKNTQTTAANSTSSTQTPGTGDEAPIGLYTGLVAAAAVVIVIATVLCRRRRHE